MIRQGLDFGPAPQRARPPAAPAVQAPPRAKPPGWRKPTDPREHVCAGCGGVGSCGVGSVWFCVPCAPVGFFPKDRVA